MGICADLCQHYNRTQVETANQRDLILMCYDGIIDNLNLAKTSLQERDLQEANGKLIKSQCLVRLLMDSTDSRQGESAKLLSSFYNFLLNRLIQANIEKNEKYIDEVLSSLAKLKEAWMEGFKNQPKQLAFESIPRKSTHEADIKGFDIRL